MKRIYVAGAYSADNVMDVLHNMGRGIKVCAKILREGNAPFCPWLDYHYAMLDEGIPLENFYEYSMKFLEVCDEMVVLPDWESSRGTKQEVIRAKELKIPITFL